MDSVQQDAYDALWRKVQVLSELAWESSCEAQAVQDWLENFDGQSGFDPATERLHALHLLGNFLFFGHREVRELLKSLYRDIFKYRLVEEIRMKHGNTLNADFIGRCFLEQLVTTRFVPLGNPSESSSHLLYYFRQVNALPTSYFAHVHDVIFRTDPRGRNVSLCVFIDDFSGTGQQAEEYAAHVVPELRERTQCQLHYYVLIATRDALDRIRSTNAFDEVGCVVELTSEYRAFSDDALYYMDEGDETYLLSKDTMKNIAYTYGKVLEPDDPLGFADGQLLLGFAHNVPDNTLPIFRSARPDWPAPFPRYPKWGTDD